MFHIYDSAPYAGPPINIYAMDPHPKYLEHFSNSLLLRVIEKETNDFAERQQARKEQVIAERKMRFWERHPSFSYEAVRRDCERLRREWQGRA
jgi:hypothetical protein